jgi:hypothetical protein
MAIDATSRRRLVPGFLLSESPADTPLSEAPPMTSIDYQRILLS